MTEKGCVAMEAHAYLPSSLNAFGLVIPDPPALTGRCGEADKVGLPFRGRSTGPSNRLPVRSKRVVRYQTLLCITTECSTRARCSMK